MWLFIKLFIVLFVSFLVFVLLYLFFAQLLSFFSTHPSISEAPLTTVVYAMSNGVHTDLIFHVDQINERLVSQLKAPTKPTPYVAIGWGDKGFYLHTPSWAELKVSTALKAAFLPSKTLMHVSYYPEIEIHWKKISLADHQLKQLMLFVSQSFKKDNEGNIQLLQGAGFTSNDFFYEAVGHYTCFYTCNVLVNQALKKASVKTALWSPFDKGILKHL